MHLLLRAHRVGATERPRAAAFPGFLLHGRPPCPSTT